MSETSIKLYAVGDDVRKLHKYDRNAFHLKKVNESVYQSPDEENNKAKLALLEAFQAQHRRPKDARWKAWCFCHRINVDGKYCLADYDLWATESLHSQKMTWFGFLLPQRIIRVHI